MKKIILRGDVGKKKNKRKKKKNEKNKRKKKKKAKKRQGEEKEAEQDEPAEEKQKGKRFLHSTGGKPFLRSPPRLSFVYVYSSIMADVTVLHPARLVSLRLWSDNKLY